MSRSTLPAMLLFASLALGCRAHQPAARLILPPAAAPVALHLELRLPRTLQGTVRRWGASDVNLLRLKLSVRRDGGWSATGLTQDLSRKTTPVATGATFKNLAGGELYRVEVEAWGNAGGTSPSVLLNAATPCRVDFDFSGGPDVPTARAGTATVGLDPVMFSGNALVTVSGMPGDTASASVELWKEGDQAATLTQTFGSSVRTARFGKLAVGPTYYARVVAKSAAGATLASGKSAGWRFDPASSDLDEDVSVSLNVVTP